MANNIQGIFKISEARKKELLSAGEHLERARLGIDFMKKLGFDTSEMENKLEWAEKMHKIISTELKKV